MRLNRKVPTVVLAILLLPGCFQPDAASRRRVRPSPPIVQPVTPVKPRVDVGAFDAASCSQAIAEQANRAGESSAFKSSEVVQGILRMLPKTGAPQDYCDRVLKAVPGIAAKPPRHLTTVEIEAIGGVR